MCLGRDLWGNPSGVDSPNGEGLHTMDNLVVVQKSKEIAHTVASSSAFTRFVDISGRAARLVGLVLYLTAFWTIKISWAVTRFFVVFLYELSPGRRKEKVAVNRSARRIRLVRDEVARQDLMNARRRELGWF